MTTHRFSDLALLDEPGRLLQVLVVGGATLGSLPQTPLFSSANRANALHVEESSVLIVYASVTVGPPIRSGR